MEYWKFLNPDGSISTVESHSYPHEVPDAIQISKEEYDAFIASLPEPEPIPPTPDEARLQELLSTSPAVITMPEIWETLRLLGKLHGIPS
ncbi:unnamed protein product [marine sediment metagenome]|uniref:Uncharacterized protein n=1 Tax=marine sediment metagenome TaxID=412755 RepID=X1VWB6_9ZZZZ